MSRLGWLGAVEWSQLIQHALLSVASSPSWRLTQAFPRSWLRKVPRERENRSVQGLPWNWHDIISITFHLPRQDTRPSLIQGFAYVLMGRVTKGHFAKGNRRRKKNWSHFFCKLLYLPNKGDVDPNDFIAGEFCMEEQWADRYTVSVCTLLEVVVSSRSC